MDPKEQSKEYILVSEDRSDVTFGDELGEMQVVRSINEQGQVDVVFPSDLSENSETVPKFEKQAKTKESKSTKPALDKDYDVPLLEPFMRNFVRFASQSKGMRLWLIPLLSNGADGIKNSISYLRKALSNPKDHGEYIQEARVRPQDYISESPLTSDLEEKLALVGLSKAFLEERGQLDTFLAFKTTDLLPLRFKVGDMEVKTEGRLALRTRPDGSESISFRCVRKSINVESPYMGCVFTEQDKQSLLETGHLGRVAQLRGADGNEFSAYISVDEETNTLVHVPSSRIYIPQTISGVELSADQRATLRSGKPLAFSAISARGNSYEANIQVDAFKRTISFTFPSHEIKKVLDTKRPDGVPSMVNGVVLSEQAQDKLAKGETLYLEGLTNSRTKQKFDSFVSYDSSSRRIRYSKYAPTDLTKQSLLPKRDVQVLPNDGNAPKQFLVKEQTGGRKL